MTKYGSDLWYGFRLHDRGMCLKQPCRRNEQANVPKNRLNRDSLNSMTDSLEGKTLLVTGGAVRIGAAVTRFLHQQGARIIVHYHTSKQQAVSLCDQLSTLRRNSVILAQGDLKNISEIQHVFNDAIGHEEKLDGLINNASRFYPTPLDSANAQQWHDLVGSNMMAPYFLSQWAAPYLRQSRGSIINITDIHAEKPLTDHSIYCSSKAGLASLTRSLAVELGPHIRVNAIAPGAILWPTGSTGDKEERSEIVSRTPLKQTGKPEDIAQAVHFLLTAADFITGQILYLDGGRSIA